MADSGINKLNYLECFSISGLDTFGPEFCHNIIAPRLISAYMNRDGVVVCAVLFMLSVSFGVH